MTNGARVFAAAVLLIGLVAVTPARGAGLALVLAIDVSASVSADSYLLQHDGIARAFVGRRLVETILAMPDGVEVLVLEWSDPDRIAVTVDWTRVVDAAGAETFAAAVRATQRSSNGLTAIGPALLAAATVFDRVPEPAARRVIDISGDGMANFGSPPAQARDHIVAAGITINGLVIPTDEPWLADYYRHNVIGGPSAFVVVARTFHHFADAIERKLIEEIADVPRRPLPQMQ